MILIAPNYWVALKPCPFCGGEADFVKRYEVIRDSKTHHHHQIEFGFVRCRFCDSKTKEFVLNGYLGINETEMDAVNAWNKRQEKENG